MWIGRVWKTFTFFTRYVLEHVHNKAVKKILVFLKNKTTKPTALGNSFRSITF